MRTSSVFSDRLVHVDPEAFDRSILQPPIDEFRHGENRERRTGQATPCHDILAHSHGLLYIISRSVCNDKAYSPRVISMHLPKFASLVVEY